MNEETMEDVLEQSAADIRRWGHVLIQRTLDAEGRCETLAERGRVLEKKLSALRSQNTELKKDNRDLTAILSGN